jgi:hypothetical protein
LISNSSVFPAPANFSDQLYVHQAIVLNTIVSTGRTDLLPIFANAQQAYFAQEDVQKFFFMQSIHMQPASSQMQVIQTLEKLSSPEYFDEGILKYHSDFYLISSEALNYWLGKIKTHTSTDQLISFEASDGGESTVLDQVVHGDDALNNYTLLHSNYPDYDYCEVSRFYSAELYVSDSQKRSDLIKLMLADCKKSNDVNAPLIDTRQFVIPSDVALHGNVPGGCIGLSDAQLNDLNQFLSVDGVSITGLSMFPGDSGSCFAMQYLQAVQQ